MLVNQQLHTMLTAAFRFIVSVDNQPLGAFTECTLPTIAWETETIQEGGQNTYARQLPGRRKQASLTLKNGIGIVNELFSWCEDTMKGQFKRRTVTITVLNTMRESVMVWHIEDALPVSWTGPQLRTEDNTIAIQSLELACGEITVSS